MVNISLERSSLLPAQVNKVQRQHLHHKHIFERRQSIEYTVEPQVVEIVASLSVAQQTQFYRNEGTVSAAEFISRLRNSSTLAVPQSIQSASQTSSLTLDSSASSSVSLNIVSEIQLLAEPSAPALASLSVSLTQHPPTPTSSSSALPTPDEPNSIYSSSGTSSSLSDSSNLISFSTYSAVSSTSSLTDSPKSYLINSTSLSLSLASSTASEIISTQTSSVTTEDHQNGESSSTSSSPPFVTDNSDNDSHQPTSTAVIAGGVVGSVAGAAVIIFLVIIFLRWYKQNRLMVGDSNSGDLPSNLSTSEPQAGNIVHLESSQGFFPAALASITKYRRSSQKTVATESSRNDSERGFYRVSGRKLPSVICHGGDGYGGGINETNTQSVSSFCHDSPVLQGGSQNPSSLAPDSIVGQPHNVAISITHTPRSATPVIEEGPTNRPMLKQLQRPDALGRSHPSLDGSHASRFTEDI